ncbi:hypothetical protein DFJ74DRAFT_645691 [Hyaloraphidium curvatum]|nr:hypothetical protein DFJ74DRAFT_645691 [Hyaloraphidium curvatum]
MATAAPAAHGAAVAAPAPVEEHKAPDDDVPPELEELLHTDPRHGLTSAEAAARLAQFGRNEIPEKKTSPFLKFLSYFLGPLAYLLEIAVVIAAVVQDWIDVGIILGVLFINAIIGFVEEAKAESALDALKNTLALKSKCWRDGELVEVESSLLVPGDVVVLRLGDIVPADARLLGLNVTGEPTRLPLSVDQSALTGESLPVTRHEGQTVYSSSVVKQGQQLGVVGRSATNADVFSGHRMQTFVGRAAVLIASTNETGQFQKIVNAIGNFLILISLAFVVIILGVQIGVHHYGVLQALKQVIILMIAAIPIGLPTVLSVTMAVGAKQLAAKDVIVKRLPAIEEFASVSVLCSDKTGTLTLNQLTFDQPYLPKDASGKPKSTPEELLKYAYLASEAGANDAIEKAVRTAAESTCKELIAKEDKGHGFPGYTVQAFVPFDPSTKYTEAEVVEDANGDRFRCIKGAPQVIIRKCGGDEAADKAVTLFARAGLRALGVARTTDPALEKFELVGLISLLDPPRPDSAATIKQCAELGVEVKMITGDQQVIAVEVARRLGMFRNILDASHLISEGEDEDTVINKVERADGFAQVIPEHKFNIVKYLQETGKLVAMTGDGVNDAPALKKADVGIAVEGATDAARSAADIVLLSSGLSTIEDGIIMARTIFQRMRSYAIYRIASTLHFLIFFFITLLAFNFSLTDREIILIAVLNDAATMVISVDNTQISRKPDKWRIGQLLTLSLVLALCITGLSFATYFTALYAFHVNPEELQTIMYLQISATPHFVIFSTRVPGYFWENRPSWVFVAAILATQVFAMFISIYGLPGVIDAGIGWGWGVSLLAVSLASMVLLDVVKVLIIKHWSFELTAKLAPTPGRRRKLAARQEAAARKERVDATKARVRNVINAVSFVNLVARGMPESWNEGVRRLSIAITDSMTGDHDEQSQAEQGRASVRPRSASIGSLGSRRPSLISRVFGERRSGEAPRVPEMTEAGDAVGFDGSKSSVRFTPTPPSASVGNGAPAPSEAALADGATDVIPLDTAVARAG